LGYGFPVISLFYTGYVIAVISRESKQSDKHTVSMIFGGKENYTKLDEGFLVECDKTLNQPVHLQIYI